MTERSLFLAIMVLLSSTPASAQVTAHARSAPNPAWNKGILPISPESYYNAIACGKQGGADPPCVFWDTGLCKNDQFVLAMYTPYKAVAYEVWQAVTRKQPAPQPNYQAAQRTRVTIGVTPSAGSTSSLKGLVLKHGTREMMPVDRSLSSGRFTFDFPAFAPTADVTIDMIGQPGIVSCRIPQAVLATFR